MFNVKSDPSKLKGFKVKIYPTESQKKFIDRQIELTRWVYNWCIEIENKAYAEGRGFLKYMDIYKLFTELYNSEEYKWLREMPKHTGLATIRHVMTAYTNFFEKRTRHPKFKSRKYSKKSFEMRNEPNAFYFKENRVRIPGLPFGETIECKSTPIIPKGDHIRYYRCTITFDNYNYWLSVNVEVDREYLKDHEPTKYDGLSIGIDLGIRTLAQLSTGEAYHLPDTHVLQKRHSRIKSRIDKITHARTKHGIEERSKNEEKLRYKEYKTRRRIINIKHSYCHKMTTEIANMYTSRIVMEDLPVEKMKSRRYFSKNYHGLFYDIRVQLEYKCRDRGIEFVLADKNFPSSQICSCCGFRHKIGSSKIYKCPMCGTSIDRDLNAAINLSRY